MLSEIKSMLHRSKGKREMESQETHATVYEQIVNAIALKRAVEVEICSLQEQINKLQREMLSKEMEVIGYKREIMRLEDVDEMSYICPGEAINVSGDTVAM